MPMRTHGLEPAGGMGVAGAVVVLSATFPARYRGRCVACDEWFPEDTMVRFTEDGIVHDDCAAAAPRERAVQPICPDCFTELPVTGVCGVCE